MACGQNDGIIIVSFFGSGVHHLRRGRHHFAIDRTSCGDNLQPAIILALCTTQVEIAHEELGGRLPRDTRVQLRSVERAFVRSAIQESSTLRGGGQGRRGDVEKTVAPATVRRVLCRGSRTEKDVKR